MMRLDALLRIGLLLACVVLPGAASTTTTESIPHIEFDAPARLCDDPVNLRLSTNAADARIVFTTDGSAPDSNGSMYERPIQVTSTTVIRAAAFRGPTQVTATATHSYLFPRDVAAQKGAGLPATWGDNEGKAVPAYYGLHREITDDPHYREALPKGLKSLPSMSIVMNSADLFGKEHGIYTHPKESGREWERPCSVELIDPAGGKGFQVDCGIRIHGGWSRRPEESPKHSFRLIFKSRYGPATLDYPLFGNDAPHEFTTLVLRGGNNNSWLHPSSEERKRADFIRDQWMRDAHRTMGYPAARGTFVHLYLNGLYWGLFNLTERPDAVFAAREWGGKPKDYDVMRADKALSGDREEWKKMIVAVNAGVSGEAQYRALRQWLDPAEFADFMVLNYYGANGDWDGSSNWYAARRREPGGQFHFIVWDGERTLEGLQDNTIAFDSDSSPPRLYHKLSENAEFRKLFSDRLRRHLGAGGALAPDAAADRFRRWSDRLDDAVVAESARWGGYRRDVHPFRTPPYELYTRDTHWRPEVRRLLDDYFPHRTSVVLEQFRKLGMYSDE